MRLRQPSSDRARQQVADREAEHAEATRKVNEAQAEYDRRAAVEAEAAARVDQARREVLRATAREQRDEAAELHRQADATPADATEEVTVAVARPGASAPRREKEVRSVATRLRTRAGQIDDRADTLERQAERQQASAVEQITANLVEQAVATVENREPTQ